MNPPAVLTVVVLETNIPTGDALDPTGWSPPDPNGLRTKTLHMTEAFLKIGRDQVDHKCVSRKHCTISQNCVCKVDTDTGNVWRNDNGVLRKCSTGDEFLAKEPVRVYNHPDGHWISFSLYVPTSNGVYCQNQQLLHKNAELQRQLDGLNAQLKKKQGKNQELWHQNAKLRNQLARQVKLQKQLAMMRAQAEKRAEAKQDEQRKQNQRRKVLMSKATHKTRSTLKTLEAQRVKLEKQIHQLQEKVHELQEEVHELHNGERHSPDPQVNALIDSDDDMPDSDDEDQQLSEKVQNPQNGPAACPMLDSDNEGWE